MFHIHLQGLGRPEVLRSLRHLFADTKPRPNITSSLAWRREQ